MEEGLDERVSVHSWVDVCSDGLGRGWALLQGPLFRLPSARVNGPKQDASRLKGTFQIASTPRRQAPISQAGCPVGVGKVVGAEPAVRAGKVSAPENTMGMQSRAFLGKAKLPSGQQPQLTSGFLLDSVGSTEGMTCLPALGWALWLALVGGRFAFFWGQVMCITAWGHPADFTH